MAEEVKAVTVNIKTAGHEQLDELIGGDEEGHFHLSKEEYTLLLDVLGDYEDELDSDEALYKLRESEYGRLTEILDLLYPDEDADPEDILIGIIDDNTDILDCGIVGNEDNP